MTAYKGMNSSRLGAELLRMYRGPRTNIGPAGLVDLLCGKRRWRMGQWVRSHRLISELQFAILLVILGFVAAGALMIFLAYTVPTTKKTHSTLIWPASKADKFGQQKSPNSC